MWAVADISFKIDDEMTDDPMVTLHASTPAGRLTFFAAVEAQGRVLLLKRMHVQGGRPNTVGAGNLRVIAEALMEEFDYDGLVVLGATRTTGANPGHRPGVLRFTRRFRADTR